MPLNLFGKKGSKGIDYKARLEHKLYLARENPEPVFDLSDCDLKTVPSGIYSLCRVFRKEALYLQENHLSSLAGGGSLNDLTLLQILDLHSNSFVHLPNEIGCLKNLRVLNLSSNQLKLLPDSIGQLERLHILNASSNHLKALPKSMGNLRRLKQLDLRNNKHLQQLPASLAQANSLSELMLDHDRFTHPPANVVEQGVVAIMQFLAEELGVEYSSPSELRAESPEQLRPDSVMDWEEKDRSFQAKILQLERLKEQKQQELLSLERDMEEHQKKELQLQTVRKSNTGRLLEDLIEQQNRLESEIHRIQQDREVERLKLINHLQEVEKTADSMISQLMALNASRDSKQLQQLLEMEQQEEQQLLNIAQAQYQSYQRKDVINAMEALLEEECLREKKLREYEEGRAEVTRTLLSQQMESDRQLEEMLNVQGQVQTQLVGRLQKDEELQRAAVGALLERSDARCWSLVHQVAIVESQLAALTAVEMERRKLEMSEQMMELSEKRVVLSALLMDLLAQQAERRQQLLNTLTEMERRRWVEEEAENQDGDFWLRQYQRLLDSRPTNLMELERTLDPLLANHLVLAGVIHCLPFLARWLGSTEDLQNITEDKLREAGVTLHENRAAILQAIKLYLEEQEIASRKLQEEAETPRPGSAVQPSAPPADDEGGGVSTMPTAECVVCMDDKCEVIFVPCGHMCTCIKCAELVQECPMCRSQIERKIRAILP
ncbi:E3 ubiquitin-protein ligase LRSAM1-like isoform X1 [Periplaneta americana]|uniref:E3 ubiquitin-protein ligase LRSAM1-like isoform X1 n=1 Tax=Periplaneta americana TaxID=6978 RepID=UPI0037E8BF6A